MHYLIITIMQFYHNGVHQSKIINWTLYLRKFSSHLRNSECKLKIIFLFWKLENGELTIIMHSCIHASFKCSSNSIARQPSPEILISVLTRVERVIVYSHSNEPKGHNNNLILIKSWKRLFAWNAFIIIHIVPAEWSCKLF